MTPDTFTAYCHAKPGVTSSFPFGEGLLVFKVCGKMFTVAWLNQARLRFNLKCDPEWSHVLRETYDAVMPGYRMNKQHWNTIILDGSIPEAELLAMIDHSYDMVVKRLKKADREQLEKLTRLLT